MVFLFPEKNNFKKVRQRIIVLVIVSCFIFEQTGFAQIVPQIPPPAYNNLTLPGDKFHPAHLRYVDFDRSALRFNVLVDKGDAKDTKQPVMEQTTKDLMTYFFAGVRLPNSSFWVNLRPDSPDRIIDDSLARTDIGRIMLAADVQLKKDLAAYTSPKTKEGKEYWDKLYRKAEELFGNEDVSIPTITRPWIVPNEVILRETTANAYIYKATLKVLLESDYLKSNEAYRFEDERIKTLNDYSSQLIKKLIIPKLARDVNISKRYAPLRQVYYSLILAQWFKARFGNMLGIDKDMPELTSLASAMPWSKDTYFAQYQESFRKGEYNVHDVIQTSRGQTIRQYFSGGIQINPDISSRSDGGILTISADSSVDPAVFLGNSQKAGITMRDGGFDLRMLQDDIAHPAAIMPQGELNIVPAIGAPGVKGLSTVEADKHPSSGAPVSPISRHRDGGITAISIREAVKNFIVLDWVEMKQEGYSYSQAVPEQGRSSFKFLPTDKIVVENLGYFVGLRPEAPLGTIPDSIDEFKEVNVTFPDEKIFLVSRSHGGSNGMVTLGFLDDGRPVAVKTYKFEKEKYYADLKKWLGKRDWILQDFKGGYIADKLGIGPRIHGRYTDKEQDVYLVMDIVLGDFMQVTKESITLDTLKDFIKIKERLDRYNVTIGDDFQFYVTPAGSAQVIDPCALEVLPPGSNGNHNGYWFNLAGLLDIADSRVEKAALEYMAAEKKEYLIALYDYLVDSNPNYFISVTWEVETILKKTGQFRDGGEGVIDLNAYWDDIASAWSRGDIVRMPMRGVEDEYSPARTGLITENTRGLSLTGTRMVEIIMSRHNGDVNSPLRVLVLGHGSGFECRLIKQLAKEYQKPVVIDALGLSEIAPSIGLIRSAGEIMSLIDEYTKDHADIPVGWKPASESVSLVTAFDMHKKEYHIFKHFDEPFIRTQFIGLFHTAVIARQYDLIYENFGPIWHSTNEHGLRKTLDKIEGMLLDQGIFYSENMPSVNRSYLGALSDKKIIVINPGFLNRFLVCKRESWFGQGVARAKGEAVYSGSGHETMNLNELFSNFDGGRAVGPFSGMNHVAGIDLNAYWEDIQAARARGDIVSMDTGGIKDEFSPVLSGFTRWNTRSLSYTGKRFLEIVMSRHDDSDGPLRVLVLGHGAGRECAMIKAMANERKKAVVIDALSLSEIAPSIRLTGSADEIISLIKEYMGKHRDMPSGWNPASVAVSLRTAFDMQNKGYDIFEILDKPFIQTQFIGLFRTAVIDQQYDFIYDNFGPFFYSAEEYGLQETLSKTVGMLKSQGIFYAESFPDVDRVSLGSRRNNNILAISLSSLNNFLVGKRGSWLEQAVAKSMGTASYKGSGHEVIGCQELFASLDGGNSVDKDLDEIERQIRSPDQNIRKEAAEILGKFIHPRAVKMLIAALDDESGIVRDFASRSLGKIGDAKAVESLIAILRNDLYFRARESAARSLGLIGDEQALDSLIVALNDKEYSVRRAAARALGILGNSKAIIPLIEAYKKNNRVAARGLGDLLFKAPDLTDEVLQTLKDRIVFSQAEIDEFKRIKISQQIVRALEDAGDVRFKYSGDRVSFCIEAAIMLSENIPLDEIRARLRMQGAQLEKLEVINPSIGVEIEVFDELIETSYFTREQAILFGMLLGIPSGQDGIVEFSLPPSLSAKAQIQMLRYLRKMQLVPEGFFPVHINYGFNHAYIENNVDLKEITSYLAYPLALLYSPDKRLRGDPSALYPVNDFEFAARYSAHNNENENDGEEQMGLENARIKLEIRLSSLTVGTKPENIKGIYAQTGEEVKGEETFEKLLMEAEVWGQLLNAIPNQTHSVLDERMAGIWADLKLGLRPVLQKYQIMEIVGKNDPGEEDRNRLISARAQPSFQDEVHAIYQRAVDNINSAIEKRPGSIIAVKNIAAVQKILSQEDRLQGSVIGIDFDDTFVFRKWNYLTQAFVPNILEMKKKSMTKEAFDQAKEDILERIIARCLRLEIIGQESGIFSLVDGITDLLEFAKGHGMKVVIISNRPEELRAVTLRVLRDLGISAELRESMIFVGYGNGKADSIIRRFGKPSYVYLVENDRNNARHFLNDMSKQGVPAQAFHILEAAVQQEKVDDSYEHYRNRLEQLVGLSREGGAIGKEFITELEYSLVSAFLKISEPITRGQLEKLQELRQFIEGDALNGILDRNGLSKEDFLQQSYMQDYLTDAAAFLNAQKDGGGGALSELIIEQRDWQYEPYLIISRPYPTKRLATEDFIESNGLEVRNGLFIGNETEPGGNDFSVCEIEGLLRFSVDIRKSVVDSRFVDLGNGPDGTQEILKGLVDIHKYNKCSLDRRIEALLRSLAERQGKRYLILDIDGTVLISNAGKKERLDVERKVILDSIVYLVRTQGYYVAFETNNIESKTWERIGKHINDCLSSNEKERVKFYTSNMVKKMRLGSSGFIYDEGQYLANTLISAGTTEALIAFMKVYLQPKEPVVTNNPVSSFDFEVRGSDKNSGRISQLRVKLLDKGIRESLINEIKSHFMVSEMLTAKKSDIIKTDKDGGSETKDVAGIDFRALPAPSSNVGFPGASLPILDPGTGLADTILARLGKSASVLHQADLGQAWSKIEQAVNSGAIPDVGSLESYVRACCQTDRIAAEREKVLLCVAEILHLEEDLNVATEPRLKEILVLLDSPALS